MEHQFNKQEVKRLNNLLQTIQDSGSVIMDKSLIGEYKFKNIQELDNLDFDYYMQLISNYLSVTQIGANKFRLTPNENTQTFLERGGFTRLYNFQQEKIQQEEIRKSLELKKLVSENRILGWQIKTFWPLFIFSIIGGICGLISFLKH